jgi:hypothetical protein
VSPHPPTPLNTAASTTDDGIWLCRGSVRRVVYAVCWLQSFLFMRLLSLGLTCREAFDSATAACRVVCGVDGVAVRMLIRVNQKEEVRRWCGSRVQSVFRVQCA